MFRFQFLSGARAGQEVDVPGPMARIGRDPANEVACDALRDDKVSTFHAQLLLTDKGQLLLSDLGSSNGTFVDGVPLTAPLPITTGTLISLGAADEGVKIMITVSEGSAPEPEPEAEGKRPIRLMLAGALVLLLLLAVVVALALKADGPDPSPTPGESPAASAVQSASPGESTAASPSRPTSEESPLPSLSASPTSSPSLSPPARPSATPQKKKRGRNPWRRVAVGTRFVFAMESVIKVGDNTITSKTRMTQTLKSLEDGLAKVEVKVESDQLPEPSVQTMEVRFDKELVEGPVPVETRSETLEVPAGKFDNANYTKIEQVMNGQTTVTENWTHDALPVGLKTVSRGATSTTTSVLIEIVTP